MGPNLTPNRGEIWRVDLSGSKGSEQQFARPCVVVGLSGMSRPRMTIGVPITTWKPMFENCAWMVDLEANQTSGLDNRSVADGSQIRALTMDRFLKKNGSTE